MSKAHKKRRPHQRHPGPPRQKPPLSAARGKAKTLVAFAAIAVLAGIPFSLGKYFELNFPDPYDSGGYAYSAAHLLAGAEIGVDE